MMSSCSPPPKPPSTAWRGAIAFGIAVAAVAAACGDDSGAGAAGGGTSSSTTSTGAGGDGGGGGAPTNVSPPPFGQPWETLGEWHLFADIAAGTPNERVVPYDLISPLFSDYATKHRYVFVPEGATITYSDTDAWEFPVGSILVKTFAYPLTADESGPLDLLETRLLYREPTGWKAMTYVYDATDTDASLTIAGDFIDVVAQTPSGLPIDVYRVPNENQCLECHKSFDDPRHLGPSTRQLDRDHDYGQGPENQLDHLFAIGFFDKAPAPSGERVRLADPFDASNPDLSYRARSYFDSNCAHCHTSGGNATPPSALDLRFAATEPGQPASNWGECVIPTSCSCCPGKTHDVVPGDPDASIMPCRLASTAIDEKMPPFGLFSHEEGVELIRAWIAAMPASSCQ
jgi:uncharacterized repeat protein (TIGR03806 family)